MRQRKTCGNCGVVYAGDGFNGSCTSACYAKFEYEERFGKRAGRAAKLHKNPKSYICPVCGDGFESTYNNAKYCSEKCLRKKTSGVLEANAKWIADEPKRKPKYSFTQLNRFAEWKRVFDDNSWLKAYKGFRG